MEGVILFADDDIFSEEPSFEKGLYQSLCKKQQYPIVGVTDLDLAKNAIKSLSSLKAFIIDYRFNEKNELEGMPSRKRLATEILDDPDISIFSLIYLYSRDYIENTLDGKRFKEMYKDRIRFRVKSSDDDKIEEDTVEILHDIEQWEKEHQNYNVPFKWNQSINQAVQNLFINLEDADLNWIAELYKTSEKDGAEPSIEVINLFQNILSEKIIQDDQLRESIKIFAESGAELSNPEDFAKLYRILYYSIIKESDPIMTGDIFKFDNDYSGILITPECDISDISKEPLKRSFEFLKFTPNDFNKNELTPKINLKATPLLDKAKELEIDLTKNQCTSLRQVFNKQIKEEKEKELIKAFTQRYPRFHILPCFEFSKGNFKNTAMIDFQLGLELKLAHFIKKENRIGKLNTPFIQELRQRYFAYKGRVGVPRFSEELRKWLLEEKS
jgi:hypothetical protein